MTSPATQWPKVPSTQSDRSQAKKIAGALLVVCLGLAFTALAIGVFGRTLVSELLTGQAVLMTTTRSEITWSHTFVITSHPVYFCLQLLTDACALAAFGGLGLLLVYCGVPSLWDPSANPVSARAQRIGRLWAFTSLTAFALYLLLVWFPYLVRSGVLPA